MFVLVIYIYIYIAVDQYAKIKINVNRIQCKIYYSKKSHQGTFFSTVMKVLVGIEAAAPSILTQVGACASCGSLGALRPKRRGAGDVICK